MVDEPKDDDGSLAESKRQYQAMKQGGTYPFTPDKAAQLNPGATPTIYSSNNPNSPNYVPPIPPPGHSQSVGVPGATPVSAAPPGLPIAPPTMGGGAPAGPSIEKQGQLDTQGSMDRQAGLLQGQQQTMSEQQAALRVGQLQSDNALQKANIDYLASGHELEKIHRDNIYGQRQRDRELDQQAAELRATDVDPQHWFKQKGTAGSILAAISMAGGAFAAAMPHSGSNKNQAADIINGAIERDIASQKENIQKKATLLKFQGDQNERKFVQDNYIENHMRETQRQEYGHALTMIDQIQKSTSNQIASKQFDILKNDIGLKMEDLTQKGIQQRVAVDVADRNKAITAQNANPLNSTNMTKSYMKYVEENEKANGGKKAEDRTPTKSFADWSAPFFNKTASTTGQAASLEGQNMISIVDGIEKIMSNPAYANTPKGRAELDELRRQGELAYPKLNTGSTRINDKELEMAKQTFSGSGGLIRSDLFGTNKATLEMLRKKAMGPTPSSSGEIDAKEPGQ
jgi:hypothetical protein